MDREMCRGIRKEGEAEGFTLQETDKQAGIQAGRQIDVGKITHNMQSILNVQLLSCTLRIDCMLWVIFLFWKGWWWKGVEGGCWRWVMKVGVEGGCWGWLLKGAAEGGCWGWVLKVAGCPIKNVLSALKHLGYGNYNICLLIYWQVCSKITWSISMDDNKLSRSGA